MIAVCLNQQETHMTTSSRNFEHNLSLTYFSATLLSQILNM